MKCQECGVGDIVELPYDDSSGFCDSCGVYMKISSRRNKSISEIEDDFDSYRRTALKKVALSPIQTNFIYGRLLKMMNKFNKVLHIIELYPDKTIDGRIQRYVIDNIEYVNELKKYIDSEKEETFKVRK